ncbi:Na+/H+ antiporter NhaC [Abyssisolibacter fermentans]|uniref:Na+/H+ antiporter NhaC n=1 Tax=Abyssisolibacter fermentans TaxID=1766203 RepID=UPI000B06DD42|nr:Na+/H+ antiporter NhaC [Abyssisolibacter fermentans]
MNNKESKNNPEVKNVVENKLHPVTFIYAVLVVFLVFGFIAFGMIAFEAPLELMFLLSWIIVVPLLMVLGYKYKELQNMAWDMAVSSFEPNVILLVVGAMIGTWIASGTIPYIIYLGLKFISPKIFLISALLLSSFTSLATGTSWGTLGTVGLALIGIGNAMGVPSQMTAGAIISGAYFGDKMSPLSDSTILSASIAGTPVMKHIKHMMYTTIPTYLISAVIFTFLGLKYSTNTYDLYITTEIMNTFESTFKFSFVELLPIILVLILLVKNIPSIISLLIGTISGGVIAVIHQHESIHNVLNYMINGFTLHTGNGFVDKLLNRGGTNSMISAFLAIFLALCISGMLEKTGILSVLVKPLIKKCGTSTFKIIMATIILTYITNSIGSSMLFASIVTGTMMKDIYRKNGLAPENLSRTLEDAGTLGAVLIPWNANALYAAQMLGVSQFAFIPFCFLNWMTPLMDLIYAKTGITIKKNISK